MAERKISLRAKAVDGKIEWFTEDGNTYLKWLSSQQGQEIKVTLERFKKSISEKQKGYWFGVVVDLLLEHCGTESNSWNKAIMATDLYMRFLPVESILDSYVDKKTRLTFQHFWSVFRAQAEKWFPPPIYARMLEIEKKISMPSAHRTLSELSTVEAEEFFTAVREWASHDLGLFVPLPNEYDPGMIFSKKTPLGPVGPVDPQDLPAQTQAPEVEVAPVPPSSHPRQRFSPDRQAEKDSNAESEA